MYSLRHIYFKTSLIIMITCDWPAAFVLFFLDVFSKTPFPETPSSNAHVEGVRVCELCPGAKCLRFCENYLSNTCSTVLKSTKRRVLKNRWLLPQYPRSTVGIKLGLHPTIWDTNFL
jgi:hypothetical protein